MTIIANAYKTQTKTLDKAITELLIVGFSGQLKRWWDYHLTKTQHLEILNFIQMNKDQILILNSDRNTI